MPVFPRCQYSNRRPYVTFKAKLLEWEDGTKTLKLPAKFTQNHCNMQPFRCSKRFGGFANSD